MRRRSGRRNEQSPHQCAGLVLLQPPEGQRAGDGALDLRRRADGPPAPFRQVRPRAGGRRPRGDDLQARDRVDPARKPAHGLSPETSARLGLRPPSAPVFRASSFPRLLLSLAVVATAAACASRPPASVPRDRFPLDPREGLAGPFDPAVAKGWDALLARDSVRAEKEFARAESGSSQRAATIGQIETLVMSGRSSDALPLCNEALREPA